VNGTLVSIYQVKGSYLSGVYSGLTTNAALPTVTALALTQPREARRT
jgi:hypothetical protein